jgi:hypothetical protein
VRSPGNFRDGRWVYLCLVAILLGWAVSACSALGCDADAQAGAPADVTIAQPAEQPAGQAGMRAYFDPKTGKMGPPPADQAAPAASAAEQSAYSTSGQGLSLVPAPGGGQMIDLQGRFQATITATLKPDGTVQTECHPSGDASAEAVGR